ncbi:hypothetical protein ACFE04_003876 [Oxalis oulophora]
MTIEEPEPNPTPDHILDWLGDSLSFFPTFLDDPYNSNELGTYQWWCQGQEDLGQYPNSIVSTDATPDQISCTTKLPESNPPTTINASLLDLSKKRKLEDDQVPKTFQNQPHKKNQGQKTSENEDSKTKVEPVKKPGGNRRGMTKGTGNNSNNKEGRWAEQLLNPCATAITAGNLTRVQHLLYVLNELASPTGDANHRLAAHGLRALTHHLSASSSVPIGPITFASTEPRFLQRSLFKFNEVSPWFAFPNNISNSSILQILSQEPDHARNLHILDIGVSHGMQWPTLLEALTRRAGGPPPLVRITIIAAATDNNDQNIETPFSVGPPGDNYSTRLLVFAKSINVNLQINKVDNHPLQNLNSQIINASPDETLIICVQFRTHHLNHAKERTEFLKVLKNLNPRGIILSENNMECSCSNCGDFATGYSRRVEWLWKFLDSTSSAFKGRETEERKVIEGEAAKGMTNIGEMNEGKEKWCERMKGVGFVCETFGEDATDGARVLLRKYDNNWEMKMDEKDGCVGLWWKGEPVSFCSLWKLDVESKI